MHKITLIYRDLEMNSHNKQQDTVSASVQHLEQRLQTLQSQVAQKCSREDVKVLLTAKASLEEVE
jgi:hypothetical protein